MAGFLDGSHVLFESHYHFLLCPIWLSICLAWSTQYISIAPLLPWQISGCWYLFPRCSFSCTDSEPEKKPFQLIINWLWVLRMNTFFLSMCSLTDWSNAKECFLKLHLILSYREFYSWVLYLHNPHPLLFPYPLPLVSLYFTPVP